jgi:hypothetical protein
MVPHDQQQVYNAQRRYKRLAKKDIANREVAALFPRSALTKRSVVACANSQTDYGRRNAAGNTFIISVVLKSSHAVLTRFVDPSERYLRGQSFIVWPVPNFINFINISLEELKTKAYLQPEIPKMQETCN